MDCPAYNLAALAVCLGLSVATGCAATAEGARGMMDRLAGKKTPEQTLHIKTPDDRMKELKELAKTGKKKPAEEQQRIVAALVKEMQQENDPLVRRAILRTLAVYPQPEALGVLVTAVSDTDMETRRVACTSLGVRGGKEAVQELTRVVASDTNLDVRIAAVRALGNTRDSTAMQPLAEALADADPAIQARARESLANVSGRDYGNNVEAWREYAKTGKADAPQVSIAERLGRMFY